MDDLNFETDWNVLDGLSFEVLCTAKNCAGYGANPHPDGQTAGTYCDRCVFEYQVLGRLIVSRPAGPTARPPRLGLEAAPTPDAAPRLDPDAPRV